MFHILLLPQTDYWNWVRACREYVLAFGTHLTPDPQAAAGYMAPRQVVSYPQGASGFAQIAEIGEWFAAQHPDVRLDSIPAAVPQELEQALAERIQSEDRFGQRQRPFSLIWPTDYPMITQRFGANPRIYNRFGMPGHEGIDMRALPNTDIYAAAEGEVYRVELDPKLHPYGIHVRIRHRDGYRTVYGHLAKAMVREGDRVETGQVIGAADTTGATVLSHLHFTLKRDFASERGETDYPKDVIDPTEFLVFPEGTTYKSLPPWAPGKCLIGAHGRIDGPLNDDDFERVRRARLECVAVGVGEPAANLDRLREINPAMMIIGRVSSDLSGDAVSARRLVTAVQQPMAVMYGAGVRYFELVPNANLESEGWGRSWPDGAGFAVWHTEVADRLRERFPEAKLGYPGLSPGDAVTGRRQSDLDFLETSQSAVVQADWIGVNCFWTDVAGMDGLRQGRLYDEYRLRFPEKLQIITEFGNPSSAIDDAAKASQYLAYYARLREQPGIAAALCYALGANSGYQALAWTERIAEAIGSRQFA